MNAQVLPLCLTLTHSTKFNCHLMIQRIQTVYLFLAALGLGSQFFLPYAAAPAGSVTDAAATFSDGVFDLKDRTGLLVSTAIAAILAAAAIFLFKNRSLQSRVTSIGSFATALLAILLAAQFFFLMKETGAQMNGVRYQAGLAMPAVAAVLLWLANRNIRKDESLVRSMDRLR